MASVVALAKARAPALSPWLKRLLYPALFIACFLIFIWLTFPFDELARSLEAQVRAQGGELTIERLRPSGLGGVAATGVKLRLPAVPGGEPLPELAFDRVTGRPDLLPLLWRRISFSFGVEGYGGKTTGHAALAKDARQGFLDSITLNARDLELRKLPLNELTGLDLQGNASLKIELVKMSPLDLASGVIAASLKAASVAGPLKGLTLPKTSLGDVELQATLDKGAAKVDKAWARNGDVEADLDGTLRLKPLFSLSQADLHARFKLTDAWLNKNPVYRGLLSAIDSARQPDGSFLFTLAGPISNINPRPGR